MDVTTLKEKIFSFSLDDGPRGNQGYSRVLLQLFGLTGHGKSSFINSCKYVLDEGQRYKQLAVAGERYMPRAVLGVWRNMAFDDGVTMERLSYDLTGNITMVDNRGYKTMDNFQRAEIYAQLGNFTPIGEKVEWTEDYTAMMERLEDAELNPNYSDFIVPILIYSTTCRLSHGDRKKVQVFMENCVKMLGFVPIVVMTKKNSGNFLEIEKAFRLMGAEVIIPLENYSEKDNIKTEGRTRDILTVIHKALENVRFRLGDEERDPRADWVQRKKFLQKYINKADRKKKEEEWKREEEWRIQEEWRREEEEREEEERRREEEEEEERRREEEEEEWRIQEEWRREEEEREEEEARRREEQERGEEEERCVLC